MLDISKSYLNSKIEQYQHLLPITKKEAALFCIPVVGSIVQAALARKEAIAMDSLATESKDPILQLMVCERNGSAVLSGIFSVGILSLIGALALYILHIHGINVSLDTARTLTAVGGITAAVSVMSYFSMRYVVRHEINRLK